MSHLAPLERHVLEIVAHLVVGCAGELGERLPIDDDVVLIRHRFRVRQVQERRSFGEAAQLDQLPGSQVQGADHPVVVDLRDGAVDQPVGAQLGLGLTLLGLQATDQVVVEIAAIQINGVLVADDDQSIPIRVARVHLGNFRCHNHAHARLVGIAAQRDHRDGARDWDAESDVARILPGARPFAVLVVQHLQRRASVNAARRDDRFADSPDHETADPLLDFLAPRDVAPQRLDHRALGRLELAGVLVIV